MRNKCLYFTWPSNEMLMSHGDAIEELALYFDGNNEAFAQVAEIFLKMITDEIDGKHLLKPAKDLSQVMFALAMAGGDIRSVSKQKILSTIKSIGRG